MASIQVAHGVRYSLPERAFDDREPPPRLVPGARALVTNLVGVPGLRNHPLKLFLHRRTLFPRCARECFEQRGNGVVLLDQRPAQHFGGMGGEHEFHAHVGQRVDLDPRRPRRLFGRLPLVRDVREVEKLVERPSDVGERVLGQFGKSR